MESCGKCRVISLCLENVYGLQLDAYSHIAIALAAYCILCIIVFLVSVVFVWIMVPDSDITGRLDAFDQWCLWHILHILYYELLT